MSNTRSRWIWIPFSILGGFLFASVFTAGFAQGANATKVPQSLNNTGLESNLINIDKTSSFTYQGRLDYSGRPANGLFDFIVELWTDENLGSKKADCVDIHNPTGLDNQSVEDGLFTFYLACNASGSAYNFSGQSLWIKVKVRPDGSGQYTTLPRQPIAATPYAFSLYPGAVISGTITTPSLDVFNSIGIAIAGASRGTNVQNGYAGTFISDNYRGLYVLSKAGYYDAYFAGTGGIYAANYWASQSNRLLAFNSSNQSLQSRDVLAIAGVVDLPDGTPLLAVQKADLMNSTAIVGVMLQGVSLKIVQVGNSQALDIEPFDGDVAAGGYLAIVTNGLVTSVRVATSSGNLQIGDWLTISSTPGIAMLSDSQSQADIPLLGKVAGLIDPLTGLVPVFVILH
jgi:hypothetical protein